MEPRFYGMEILAGVFFILLNESRAYKLIALVAFVGTCGVAMAQLIRAEEKNSGTPYVLLLRMALRCGLVLGTLTKSGTSQRN